MGVGVIYTVRGLTHGRQWQRSEEVIKGASPDGNEMLLNGRAPLPGELMTFPTLAQSFREISIHGKDGFYKGRIAEEIVKVVQSKGGVMELEDLAKHKTDFVDPIKYTYMGEVTVHEVSEWRGSEGRKSTEETSALQMDKVRIGGHLKLCM